MIFLVNDIGDTITNSMNEGGFADFNKTFLCEGDYLRNSLKLLDCSKGTLMQLSKSPYMFMFI